MIRLLPYLVMLVPVGSFATATDSVVSHSPRRRVVTEVPPSTEDYHGTSYYDRYVKPHSVPALISYCATQWMQEERDSFAAMPERLAVRHHHYWYDTWINKMWGILVNDSGVTAGFKVYGIADNEDKWLITLTSLHRRLNHRDMDIAGQVRDIKKKKRKTAPTTGK